MKKVRIRYCGGCNPRYDRARLADRIRKAFPEYDYTASEDADLTVSLCGCPARCIAEDAETSLTVFNLTEWKEIEDFLNSKGL